MSVTSMTVTAITTAKATEYHVHPIIMYMATAMTDESTCPKNTFLGRARCPPGVPKRMAVLAPNDVIRSPYPMSNVKNARKAMAMNAPGIKNRTLR